MKSIRQAANCIGVSGNFSVMHHLMGFFRGRVPTDPTGITIELSIEQQLDRLKHQQFHVNIIAIGVDEFKDGHWDEIDYSIYKMRNIFDQVNVTVGRVQHYGVETGDDDDQARGLEMPTTRAQLEEITDTWSVPNNGIDVFVPFNMSVGTVVGRSAVDGPCEAKSDKGMNGSVGGLWGAEQTARTLAHEVGHYLSLEHRNSSPNNLMCQSSSANSTRNSVDLTAGQGSDIRGHCLVKSGC